MSFGVADPARPISEPAARPENVRALERGLAIIQAFDAEHTELTLSEVAKQTGLPRAVVRRFLYTLEDLGYVRTDGKNFSLRPKVLQLGYAYLSSFGLPEIARAYLEDLAERIDRSAGLGVLDGTEIVYVAQARGQRTVNVGRRFPAHATSMGRVLLAGRPTEWLDDYLATTTFARFTPQTRCDPGELRAIVDQVRAAGWALVDQELEVGLRAVAVPVRQRGEVVAALNVTTRVGGGDGIVEAREMVPVLRRTAAAIERDLAAAPHS